MLVVDGLTAGVLGAIIGAAIGFGLWFWYYPRLEVATAHRTDPLNLPWAAVVIGLLLAVATSVIAAAWPGRAVSKVPVVAAISGRVAPPHVITRSPRPGLIFLAAGLFVLYFSGGWNGGGRDAYLVIAALIACVIACALLAPFLVDRLAVLAWRAPLATRLALRDLARYRSRSGAAMAAVSFAVFIATITILIATVRFGDALDYVAPNMASNQLILYAPGNDPAQYQPGQFTPAAKPAAAGHEADTLAETASDLRTLTATGAAARTRRALTGVTTGAIALLGAALGTVAAFLATLAWAHSSLTQMFGGVPWSDVGLLLIGMPLVGAAAGWLLGGRAPSAVTRQALE